MPAMPATYAEASGPHEPPPTSITMRTHVLHGRPTATWAAALVVLGVFVGLGSAIYARGDAGNIAAWMSAGRTAAASQPVADSFSQPQPVAQATMQVRTSPAPVAVPAVDRPPVERTSAPEAAAPSEPLAALMGTPAHGESTTKVASSRATFVAPGSSYSPPAHVHHSAPAARPEPPPAPAAPPVAALASAPQEPSLATAPAALPPPPAAAPAPTKASSKSRNKKANDDDMQAASASDALARAQLEAALR